MYSLAQDQYTRSNGPDQCIFTVMSAFCKSVGQECFQPMADIDQPTTVAFLSYGKTYHKFCRSGSIISASLWSRWPEE